MTAGGLFAVVPGAGGSTSVGAAQKTDYQPNLLGPLAWYKMSDYANLANGATPTGNLKDHSGNGLDATSYGNNPYKTTMYDGRTALRFSGGTGFYLPSGVSVDRANCSIYVIMKHGILASSAGAGFWIDIGSGLQFSPWYNNYGSGRALEVYPGPSAITSSYLDYINNNIMATGYRGQNGAPVWNLNGTHYPASGLGGGVVSGGRIGGIVNNGSFDFIGDIAEILIFNYNLSDDQERYLYAYFNRPPTRYNVMLDGNSLFVGHNPDLNDNVELENTAPFMMARMLGDSYKIYNYAVSGQTTEQMESDQAGQINTLIDNYNFPNANIVCAWELTNSIYAAGDTGPQALAAITAYAASSRAAGARVILGTCIDRPGGTALETARAYVNTWLRLNWSTICDGLADVDAALQGISGGYTNGYYWSYDQTHLLPPGYEIVAHVFANAVQQLVAAPAATPYPPIRVVTASGAITLNPTVDSTIIVNKTTGAASAVAVTTANAKINQVFAVKDGKGDANTNNITITPSSGLIDNASSYVISSAKGAIQFQFDGTNYWIT